MLSPSAFLPSPGIQLGTRRLRLQPQHCHHLLVTLAKTLVPLPFSKMLSYRIFKVLSSLIFVTFRFPWDLVCLSAEAESKTSSHPILLVSTERGSLGSGDGGQGLRISVSTVAAKSGAGLAHSPTDSN